MMGAYNLNGIPDMPCAEKPSDSCTGHKSRLISVEEMGRLLGLRKTARYWLLQKNLFATTEVLGKQWIIRDSFEKWYAGQQHYHIEESDDPDDSRSSGGLTVKEIATLIGRSEKTVNRLIRENNLETFIRKNRLLVPAEAFQSWIAGQDRYKICDNLQEEYPENTGGQETIQNRSGAGRHNPEYLSVREAADLAGVSLTTVFTLIRNRQISAKRCGRKTYISKESFTAWISRRREEA